MGFTKNWFTSNSGKERKLDLTKRRLGELVIYPFRYLQPHWGIWSLSLRVFKLISGDWNKIGGSFVKAGPFWILLICQKLGKRNLFEDGVILGLGRLA